MQVRRDLQESRRLDIGYVAVTVMGRKNHQEWRRLLVLFLLGLSTIAYMTNVASGLWLESVQANEIIVRSKSSASPVMARTTNSSRALSAVASDIVLIDCSTVSSLARVLDITSGPSHVSFLPIVNESSHTNIACLPPNVINHHVVNMNGRQRLGQGEKILVLGLPYTDNKLKRVSSFLQASQRFKVCHEMCNVPVDIQHHWTGNLTTKRAPIGSCLKEATGNLALPPLRTCGNYDVYGGLAMISSLSHTKCILPQVTMLQEFHDEHPDATFVLNLVPVDQWIAAGRVRRKMLGPRGIVVRRAPAVVQGLIHNCGAGPKNDDDATLRQYYHDHVQRVRQFVAHHPSHALVEIDIQNNQMTASRMANLFGIDESLWGQRQRFDLESNKPTKEAEDRDGDEIPPFVPRTLPIVQEQTANITSLEAHVVNHHVVNHNGQHPLGQGEKIILLGLPGSDPTFVTSFFKQSERYSKMCLQKCTLPVMVSKYANHKQQFKGYLLGKCLRKARKKSLPNPIATCGDYNLLGEMYVSADRESGRKCALPQISMLELFHEEHSNATFVLNIMDAWHWSNMIIERNIHRDLERCQNDIGPGKDLSQFDLVQWYYQHVQRVRQFVMDHPTHALVEIDVMNHDTTTQRMIDIFGLGSSANKKALSANSFFAQ